MKFKLVLFSLILASTTLAQVKVSVRGAGRLFPIGLPQLCLAEGVSPAPKDIPEVVSRDLTISGFFEVLNPNIFIERPGRCGDENSISYTDWSAIGAEGVVRGEVFANPNGSRRIRLWLHDIVGRRVVLGKEYVGDETQIRQIAHRFANEVLKYFTGESGVFGSQISFSSRIGRFKELYVMDMDGSNLRQLTQDRGLALSSSFSPDGKGVVYTSYRNRVPNIFFYDLYSKRVQQITQSSDLEMGPKMGRNGEGILAAVSTGRESNIVLYDSNGRIKKRLTKGGGIIDVSPDWSPDHSQIAFCSNRGGGPQIYVMNADGSNPRRISFASSNYCTSPAWSPRGDKIAYVCRADSGFNIFVSRPDGSEPIQLTSGGSSEDPSWSPDGRYITFASTFGRGRTYNLAMMRVDTGVTHQLTSGGSDDTDPSWGPLPQ